MRDITGFKNIPKKIVYNFRKNDIINGGEGAPLTPIFHQLIVTQKKIKFPFASPLIFPGNYHSAKKN